MLTVSLGLQTGPHFADWGEMSRQGAVSMASAPVRISNEVRAVLTLASGAAGAFEEASCSGEAVPEAR